MKITAEVPERCPVCGSIEISATLKPQLGWTYTMHCLNPLCWSETDVPRRIDVQKTVAISSQEKSQKTDGI